MAKDDLISIAECARQIGMHKSTLHSQVKAKQIRSYGNKVRLSEVLEDRANNIDLTRSARRAGQVDQIDELDPTKSELDPTIEAEDGEPVIVDGAVLPYKEARALKETYLARLRQLEFQIKSGAFVEIEAVGRQVEREYSTVRERVLVIPGKLSSRLVGLSQAEIYDMIRLEVTEALAELSNSGLAA